MSTLHAITLAILCSAAAQPHAQAPDYPNRPLRIIVPSTPGGSIDLSARIIGKKLEDRFKNPVIVENRPGGNTMVGSLLVANATAVSALQPPCTHHSDKLSRNVSACDTLLQFRWEGSGIGVGGMHGPDAGLFRSECRVT